MNQLQMLLVVDANIVVGVLLRSSGRILVANPRLELFICTQAESEALHELQKRGNAMVRKGSIQSEQLDALLQLAIASLRQYIQVMPELLYLPLKSQARSRIPRDPDDWPTLALAMVLNAGIWTEDGDFLGCGLPTWTTQTLRSYQAVEPG